jgi:hypothetical protein
MFKGLSNILRYMFLLVCINLLAGCETTQSSAAATTLGKTLGKVLTGEPLQANTANTNAGANSNATADPRRGIRSIADTELAGLFTTKPLRMPNGRNAQYPRVAITVDEHSAERLRKPRYDECYFMHARIWDAATKSRDVAPFSVCMKDVKEPVGGFMRADTTLDIWNSGIASVGENHTGSTRTEGPQFPQRPVPSGPLDAVGISPSDTAYFFVHATLTNMNFDFTQADPRVWFVKFGKLDAAGFQAFQDSAHRLTKSSHKTDDHPTTGESKPVAVKTSIPQDNSTAASKRPVGPPMSYAALVKIYVAAGGQAPKVRSALLGKSIQLSLKAPGPDSLVVDVKDEIFFSCVKRAPGFKGGKITTVITDYEDSPEGHGPIITLEHCP